MQNRHFHIKDDFKLNKIPFIVHVYDDDMYINGKSRDIKGINTRGNPAGLKGNGRHWVRCRCMVAKVRPDYPYTIKHEWTDDIDKHIEIVQPYEIPKRNIIFYSKKDRDVKTQPEELAEAAINKLKQRFEDYERPKELDSEIKP